MNQTFPIFSSLGAVVFFMMGFLEWYYPDMIRVTAFFLEKRLAAFEIMKKRSYFCLAPKRTILEWGFNVFHFLGISKVAKPPFFFFGGGGVLPVKTYATFEKISMSPQRGTSSKRNESSSNHWFSEKFLLLVFRGLTFKVDLEKITKGPANPSQTNTCERKYPKVEGENYFKWRTVLALMQKMKNTTLIFGWGVVCCVLAILELFFVVVRRKTKDRNPRCDVWVLWVFFVCFHTMLGGGFEDIAIYASKIGWRWPNLTNIVSNGW